MKHYVYTDRNQGPVIGAAFGSFLSYPGNSGKKYVVHTGVVIFECDAIDIVDADAKMQSASGIDPSDWKQLHITCSFTDVPVAQMVERKTTNLEAAGSTPAGNANSDR